MPPNSTDIVGRWSEDLGYSTDLSRDTVLEFSLGGTLSITAPGDRIEGRWEMTEPGLLTLILSGNRYGPFTIRIERERLPRGEFLVLKSSGGLLPFDRCRFTRVEGPV